MTAQPKTLIPKEEQLELFQLCADSPKHGAIVEVGVYCGGTAWVLSQVADGRPLHLFDTFNGMPTCDAGDIFPVGSFSDTSAAAVKAAVPSAIVHEGIFPDTFPSDLTDISFAHLDCDHYAGTKAAIDIFWPRMLPNAVMAFDDSGFTSIKQAIDDSCLANVRPRRTARNMLYYVKGAE
jgi:O-methyltransferase